MSGYTYSALVEDLLAKGMTRIQILLLLMKDYSLTHWQANREVYTYLKRKGKS